MKPELYFDISSEEQGGSLYRQQDGSFQWHFSTYDSDRDETKVFKESFSSFESFWKKLTQDKEWYFQHPLFVHPEVRAFVRSQLQHADWTVQGDVKWQMSHQRQWTRVLTGKSDYYDPL